MVAVEHEGEGVTADTALTIQLPKSPSRAPMAAPASGQPDPAPPAPPAMRAICQEAWPDQIAEVLDIMTVNSYRTASLPAWAVSRGVLIEAAPGGGKDPDFQKTISRLALHWWILISH